MVAPRGPDRKPSPAGRRPGSIHRLVSRRFLLLANPISGGGRSRVLAPAVAEQLRALGCEAEVYFTKAAGDATQRARAAGSEPWDALVACGGDGTVNEVLNGMPDPTRPLGVLPVGTANVLALEYRLPRDPARAAKVLAAFHPRDHAIGLVGERRFLLFCGVGLDASIVERVHHARTGTLGKLKWLPSIAATIWHWPQHRLRATFDDGTVLDDLSSVLVTRVRGYGGVAQLPRSVDPGSGLLHVLSFRGRSRFTWGWMGLRAALRCLGPSASLDCRTARSLTIDGEAPLQVDGDFGGRAPVRLALETRPARLLVP